MDSGTGSVIRRLQGRAFRGSNPHERPLKPGEFVLGYSDEMGGVPAIPKPDILGRNGSYVVFRKLHQRVATFRQYLKANSSGPEAEELVAAKITGRWRSGAPLALCPLPDDPELGADRLRNKPHLVILSRRKAAEALNWTRQVVTRMGVTLNEAKTSIKQARQ